MTLMRADVKAQIKDQWTSPSLLTTDGGNLKAGLKVSATNNAINLKKAFEKQPHIWNSRERERERVKKHHSQT